MGRSAAVPKSTQGNLSVQSKSSLETGAGDLAGEIAAKKRQALAYKKAGNLDAARAELAKAKQLERQLANSDSLVVETQKEAPKPQEGPANRRPPRGKRIEDDGEEIDEDALDAELAAKMKALGLMGGENSKGSGPSGIFSFFGGNSAPSPPKPQERAPRKDALPRGTPKNLESEIQAQKVKAVQLKREGRTGEALEALKVAKALEAKLSSQK